MFQDKVFGFQILMGRRSNLMLSTVGYQDHTSNHRKRV